ncbi:hypothetical protein CHUAL_008590 [Chamberlinius hualienensis]
MYLIQLLILATVTFAVGWSANNEPNRSQPIINYSNGLQPNQSIMLTNDQSGDDINGSMNGKESASISSVFKQVASEEFGSGVTESSDQEYSTNVPLIEEDDKEVESVTNAYTRNLTKKLKNSDEFDDKQASCPNITELIFQPKGDEEPNILQWRLDANLTDVVTNVTFEPHIENVIIQSFVSNNSIAVYHFPMDTDIECCLHVYAKENCHISKCQNVVKTTVQKSGENFASAILGGVMAALVVIVAIICIFQKYRNKKLEIKREEVELSENKQDI